MNTETCDCNISNRYVFNKILRIQVNFNDSINILQPLFLTHHYQSLQTRDRFILSGPLSHK